ncbi:MAG: 4Fe-4S dicluster domain-containing protein [Eggerthellaceae bacterium]|nr:4Fe-4S dicluster domain-containing protein [Eggerthellaceae bacterium]
MMRYGMAIDLKRCSGCKTCSVVCKVANNVPEGILWNRVLTDGGEAPDTSSGTYPDASIGYLPVQCNHCENPACVKACPVGATWKDKETGIVHQDYDKCIGCRMCIAVCPYTGIRSFNWQEPKNYADYPLGDAKAAVHQKHTVEKCIFCEHRVAEGKKPACVEQCLARARTFGDLDDPDSEVSKLIATRETQQLHPEFGTNPSIYYLV